MTGGPLLSRSKVSMSGSEQLLLAPTPFIIGIPTSFLVVKRNVALPEDVWLVDLDEAKIMPPEASSEGREDAFHMNDSLCLMQELFAN